VAAVLEAFDPLHTDVGARANQKMASHFFTRRPRRRDERGAAEKGSVLSIDK
jgi:hypothetical protein